MSSSKDSIKAGFNPCFNGTLSETALLLLCFVASTFVSILVLMELSLRPDMRAVLFPLLMVSILVLMELSLRQSGRAGRSAWIRVSILVLMELSLRPVLKALKDYS